METSKKKSVICGTTDGYWGSVQSGTPSFQRKEVQVMCKTKNLIEDFYVTRKSKRGLPSAYSYECKDCTIKRILNNRKGKQPLSDWQYPDW